MSEGGRNNLANLDAIPRLQCGFYPTPIEELPRLRAALGGGPRLFIKRDDYTGVGFGGNKVRKLEYVLARALAEGAEVVVTIGGERSNHARVTAALCARLGLRCVLVLNRGAHGGEAPELQPASIFVDEAVGAEIRLVGSREERAAVAAEVAEKLRREGRRVAEIPLGASVPLGALGFVGAMREAAAQCDAMGVRPNYIFHASSSGGTQAGLIAGCQLLKHEHTRIIGVSPDDPAESIAATVIDMVKGIHAILGTPAAQIPDGQVTVLDEYVGPGYGLDTPASVEALRLVARTEGVFLDPVYTAKAMAALLDWIRRGRLTEQDTVLFWHTGGQLAMFYAPG